MTFNQSTSHDLNQGGDYNDHLLCSLTVVVAKCIIENMHFPFCCDIGVMQ